MELSNGMRLFWAAALLALAACGGAASAPYGTAGLSLPGAVLHPSTAVKALDSKSILKKLTKDVTIGSTVDPANGDVAVADFTSVTQWPGALSIFHNGKVLPSSYQDSAFNAYFFCSYDDRGNVFVDGADVGSYHTDFAELTKGSTAFTNILLDKTIGYPVGVQWDGKYMAVQDTASRVLYRFKIAGDKGKSVGSVRFAGDKSTLLHQFWVQAPSIVMPYGPTGRQVRRVGIWPYPAGGTATNTFVVTRSTELVGVTVSLAKK